MKTEYERGLSERRLARLAGSIQPRDLEAERQWQRDVRDLDTLAAIIANNPRVAAELAKIQEHHPELTPYQQQLEAKRVVVESDERGDPELWARTLGRLIG